MTGLTDEQIAEIKARADAATPGPWESTDGDVWIDTREMFCCGRGRHECCGEPDVAGGQELVAQTSPTDAAFIAHARTDIPLLLSALEAEKKRADEAEKGNKCYECGSPKTACAECNPDLAERDTLRAEVERLREAGNYMRRVVDVMRAHSGRKSTERAYVVVPEDSAITSEDEARTALTSKEKRDGQG